MDLSYKLKINITSFNFNKFTNRNFNRITYIIIIEKIEMIYYLLYIQLNIIQKA